MRIQIISAWFTYLFFTDLLTFLLLGDTNSVILSSCWVFFCHYPWFIFPVTCQTWVIFNPLLGLPRGIISYLLTLHMISQFLLSYRTQIPSVYFLPLTWVQLLFLFFNKSANLDNLQPLSVFQTICMNPLNRITEGDKSFRASAVIFSFGVRCSETQFYDKI